MKHCSSSLCAILIWPNMHHVQTTAKQRFRQLECTSADAYGHVVQGPQVSEGKCTGFHWGSTHFFQPSIFRPCCHVYQCVAIECTAHCVATHVCRGLVAHCRLQKGSWTPLPKMAPKLATSLPMWLLTSPMPSKHGTSCANGPYASCGVILACVEQAD